MRLLLYCYKAVSFAVYYLQKKFSTAITSALFSMNGVHGCFKNGYCYGIPFFRCSINGKIISGNGLKIASTTSSSAMGYRSGSKIIINPNAVLKLGKNVGMTNVAILCNKEITIGDNVLLGDSATIFDSDFHSLNVSGRTDDAGVSKPVFIGDNVFVGANAMILKGVTVGNNSVVAAGSVVTKDILPNQIWGGNPARFIRELPAF